MAWAWSPIRAIQMASINTARHFGMRGRGAVAPGYRADLVILDDLEEFTVWKALLEGRDVFGYHLRAIRCGRG